MAFLVCSFFRQRRAQRFNAGGGRIACLVLDQRLHHRVLDGFRCIEEGLAAVKGVHGLPGGAQFEHLVANLHNIGEAHLVEALGQS